MAQKAIFCGLLVTAFIVASTVTAQGDDGQSDCREPAKGVETVLEDWRVSGLRAAVRRKRVQGVKDALQTFPSEFWKYTDSSDSFVVTDLIDALDGGVAWDWDWEVQQAAAQALGQIEGTYPQQGKVVSALIKMLLKGNRNGNPHLRVVAAQSLGQIEGIDAKRGAEVVSALTKALSDRDANVRFAAAQALVQIGSIDSKPVLSALNVAFSGGDHEVRRVAALAIGQIAGTDPKQDQDEFVSALIPALWDNHPGIEQAAAEMIGQIGSADPRQVVPKLIDALKIDELWIQRGAVRALGQIGSADPDQVVPALIGVINDSTWWIEDDAALALGQIGSTTYSKVDEIVTVLTKALSHKDDDVVIAAAQALGQIGSSNQERVMPVFYDAIDSDNQRVRQAAALALGQILRNDVPEKVMDELIVAIQSEEWRWREAAAKTLGQIGPKDSKWVMDALGRVLSNKDAEIWKRISAARALEKIKSTYPEKVLNALIDATQFDIGQDFDDDLRQAAVLALGQIGGTSNSKRDAVVTALTMALSDKDDDVVIAAAQALGGFKDLEWETIIPVAFTMPTKFDDLLWDFWKARELLIRQYVKDLPSSNVSTSLVLLNQIHSDDALLRRLRLWARFFTGDNECGLILVDWLGRPSEQPLDDLDGNADLIKRTIRAFANYWKTSEGLMNVRSELKDATVLVLADYKDTLGPADVELLTDLKNQLSSPEYDSVISQINDIISDIEPNPIANGALVFLAGQATLWVLLIFAYPYSSSVQEIFFWDKRVRWFLGFGYVQFLLINVPFLRRLLFKPFRKGLLADAELISSDESFYFDGSHASCNSDGEQRKIVEAIPEIRGQIVLEGESGLGKTMFIRKLVEKYPRVVVFLPATKCDGGVIEAIQYKVGRLIRDTEFLERQVFAGAIDVIIDGLNEVSESTRDKIDRFAEKFDSGNLLITTQPMEWTEPPNFHKCVLQPLSHTQIEEFLLTSAENLPEDACVRGDDYKKSCRKFIDHVLETSEPDLQKMALNVLSNPFDLTVISDSLSRGERPDIFNLRQQQYDAMANDYKSRYTGNSFPLTRFSEQTYMLREKGEKYFDVGEFHDELARMKVHRMIVKRPTRIDDSIVVASCFRHEKIMNFFLYQAFKGNIDRQLKHLGDANFHGAYLFFVTNGPRDEARALREAIVNYAGDTNDYSLFSQFIPLFNRYYPGLHL